MNNKQRAIEIKKLIQNKEMHPFLKRLKIGTLISEAFAEKGFKIIMTGGAAVEFYTAGNYVTGDTDFYVKANATKESIMHELGFKGFMQEYHLDGEHIEFVSTKYMGDEEKTITQKNEYGSLIVIGFEDILLDRIKGAKFWDRDTPVYEEWAVALLYNNFDKVDWEYLSKKAQETECNDMLKHIKYRVLEQRREVVYEHAKNIVGITDNNYPPEKDYKLFAEMEKHPLHIPAKEIRIALKTHSPHIKDDLSAYNIERKIHGLKPAVKQTKKRIEKSPLALPPQKQKEQHIDNSEWIKIDENTWKRDYTAGYTGLIQKLQKTTFIVRFGKTNTPRNKWKDVTGKHSLNEAKAWCDSRGFEM